jgi:hypothetical protein
VRIKLLSSTPPTGLRVASGAPTATVRTLITNGLKAIFTIYGLPSGPSIPAVVIVFGEIRGETRTLPPSVADLNCDYERTTGANAIVLPRRAIRRRHRAFALLHARRISTGPMGRVANASLKLSFSTQLVAHRIRSTHLLPRRANLFLIFLT